MPDREEQPRRKKAIKKSTARKNWHPDHAKAVRTTFVSERHAARMWKL